MLPAQPNQSLIDGLECLQTLAASRTPLGVREMARRLDMEPTRVQRFLRTLAHLSLTQQTPDRKYTIGPGMHVLSAQSLSASGLLHRCYPHLEKLMRFHVIVALGVLWRTRVSYLYHANPDDSAIHAVGRMGVVSIFESSVGMVLLAQATDEQIRKLYSHSHELEDYPGGMEALLQQIHQIRKDGYGSFIFSKKPLNVSMAVPIGNPAYAGLALSGKIEAKDRPEMIKELLKTAQLIDEEEKQHQKDVLQLSKHKTKP